MNVLDFDDVAVVINAPRWAVPAMRRITAVFGPARVARCLTWLPVIRHRRLGLAVFDPKACTIIDEGRHCLVQLDWQWTLYRALTDLQRFSWNGVTVEPGHHYRSPMLER